MVRIRYAKTEVQDQLLSTSLYSCLDGRQVRVKLSGNTLFEILDENGNVLENGGSKKGSATYLKRLVKQRLGKLLAPDSFQKEVRQKRS